MKRNPKRALERSFVATISQFAFCCHEAIEKVQTTANLPLFCYEQLASANLCTIHANRICNIFEHILTQENASLSQRLQSFNPENILSGIAKTLADTVADSISMKIDCDSHSICDFPVTVNQAKFEFAFLNLLYCSIRSGELSSHKTTRINLSVKELKDSLQFHIKDNGNLINPLITENLRAGNPPLSGFVSTRDTLISFSLDVADKIIFDMDGNFSYKALKSGNRYDIILPKFPDGVQKTAKSPSVYVPAIRVYKEIFEDIIGGSSYILNNIKEDIS
ncbi:MAG: hypothetical protein IKB32_02960 [Clostridia bacterium]|nr:hypothetical protein [Clostridia bacterium]